MAKKWARFVAGMFIGGLIGFGLDQAITHYALLHAERPATLVITNAVGAFVVFPVSIALGAFIGYRWLKGKN